MDILILPAILIGALVAFDLAALRWGVDSRPSLRDDHAR